MRILAIAPPRRFASLRAPAKPWLAIAPPRRFASLRAPAGPWLAIAPPQRFASLRAPAGPWLAIAAALAGCGQDVDPPWQLDHDRVIAVRATPPRIPSGSVAALDALLGREGQPPLEVALETATVVSPTALATALSRGPTGWIVTAPGPEQLAAARRELELADDAPVPLRVRATFAETGLVGLKVIWLGEHADNPALDPVMIDGVNRVSAAQLSVSAGVDILLSVDFDDNYVVNWLTSCGEMHDFDLPDAYLRVEPEDPQSGVLGVVVRDALGGVAWRLWPIAAK